MAQHSSKGARFQAVTANRLLDGEVVYLAADNSWTEVFANADIADGADACDALLARACPDGYEKHVFIRSLPISSDLTTFNLGCFWVGRSMTLHK